MKNWNHNIDKAIQWWNEDRSAYQFIVGFSAFLGVLLGALGAIWIFLLVYIFFI